MLDLYGHFLPSDYRGFADALGSPNLGSPKPLTAPQAHPALRGVTREADARTQKLKNTAMFGGSPGSLPEPAPAGPARGLRAPKHAATPAGADTSFAQRAPSNARRTANILVIKSSGSRA